MRAALVLNARSGALLSGTDRSQALLQALREGGLDAEPVPASGSLPERMARAIDSGAEALIVAGGDGSIACAAQAIAGRDVALGILPCGTMNLLARDLGLPVDDPARAAARLARGQVRAIDMAEIEDATGETYVFLCAAMLGEPARLARVREQGRGGAFGWLRLGVAALRAAGRPRLLRGELAGAGAPIRLRTPSLTISVNALDDASDHLFGRASLTGGTLVAYSVRPRGIPGLLRLAFGLLFRRTRETPELDCRSAAAFTLTTHGASVLRVLADGEMRLLRPPLTFRVRPGGLRVLAPAEAES